MFDTPSLPSHPLPQIAARQSNPLPPNLRVESKLFSASNPQPFPWPTKFPEIPAPCVRLKILLSPQLPPSPVQPQQQIKDALPTAPPSDPLRALCNDARKIAPHSRW